MSRPQKTATCRTNLGRLNVRMDETDSWHEPTPNIYIYIYINILTDQIASDVTTICLLHIYTQTHLSIFIFIYIYIYIYVYSDLEPKGAKKEPKNAKRVPKDTKKA